MQKLLILSSRQHHFQQTLYIVVHMEAAESSSELHKNRQVSNLRAELVLM